MKQCTEEATKETREAITCAATLIGHNNSNWVSALTNNPNIFLIDTGSTMPAFPIQPSELLQAQMEDKFLGPVISYLKSNQKPPSHLIRSEHRHVKRLLYEWNKLETCDDGVLIRNNGNTKQLVLQYKYHRLVLKELHKNMGHFGSDRVFDLAHKFFSGHICTLTLNTLWKTFAIVSYNVGL